MVIAGTATRPRQLTARETGRKWISGVYERGVLDKSRGRGREGISVRPIALWLAWVLDRLAASPAAADWLEAGARPNAIAPFRVAAAHCDERERRALFTSQNSNSNSLLQYFVILSGSASAVQHTRAQREAFHTLRAVPLGVVVGEFDHGWACKTASRADCSGHCGGKTGRTRRQSGSMAVSGVQ